MKLFVNDTEVGITPSPEDTIQILLQTISRELDNDLIIANMIVDGKYYSLDAPEILGQLISNTEKIELTVATRGEIGVALLEDGKNFITFSAQELKNGCISKKEEIITSFAWIIESLDALQTSLAFPPAELTLIRAEISHIIKILDYEENISTEDMGILGSRLETLIPQIECLQEKILHPEIYSEESTFNKLIETQKILPDLAYHFQTGNDVQAIQELCSVIDMIEMFTRYAASLPENTMLETHAIALKDLSMKLLQAFENKDFILVADLLEYDLNEQIDMILER